MINQKDKKNKGIIRTKFDIFLLCKEATRKKPENNGIFESRFSKNKLNGSGSTTSSNKSAKDTKTPLIELQQIHEQMNTLPPEWVDRYHQCTHLISDIDQIKKNMALEQNRRLTCLKESEQKLIDQKIYNYASQATQKIRKCQTILKNIQREAQIEFRNQKSKKNYTIDQKTCQSICMKLALEIQEKTRQIRAQQRAFVEYRKQIENTTKVSFLQLTAEKMLEDPETYSQLQQSESLYDAQRNKQLLNIVESIHELNDLYKQLNNLVIVQGSLLDRIDQNIQQSVAHVQKGVQHLGQAEIKQKKRIGCGCIFMIVLLVLIAILGIVLIIKHR